MAHIGILGGTFDPPHRAHVAMAKAALERIPLDKVLVMPAPSPPHKHDTSRSDYYMRMAMARIAFAGYKGIELSDMERFRQGPSYTADLLRHYHANHDDCLYLILGADSVSELGAWRDPQLILRMATLVVFPRTGFSSTVPIAGPASVVLFEEPVIDVSSTEVRDSYRRGGDAITHLPPGVHDFILDNGLYS
jgi:nicotinate-nucleotide adenylyltransferase